MRLVTSTQLNAGTKKGNYIQKPDANVAMFDSTHAYYWEPASGSKPGFWAYKNLGPNKEPSGTAVPDEEIGPGEGFFVSLPQTVTIMLKVPDAIKNL